MKQSWILLGGSAHALSLLIIDIISKPRLERKGTAKAGSNKLPISWASKVGSAVVALPNTVGDSERARQVA
jgi:hypothetical protein